MHLDILVFKIILVLNLDTSNLTNMQNMFYSCSKLQQLDLKNWKTDLVTNMNGMFMSCNSLQQLDLSSWTMEKVEDVNQMFYMCSKLTKIDLSSWKNGNTGVNFSSCFYSCKSLQELDMRNIDFTKVILFSGMMSNVPENCKFIVKDETQKERVQKMFPNLTNIVTVTELGEE